MMRSQDWFAPVLAIHFAVSKYNVGDYLSVVNTRKGIGMAIKDTETSLRTLGNASELVAGIIQEVVGNDIADSIGDSPITRETIYQLAQSQFAARLSKITG